MLYGAPPLDLGLIDLSPVEMMFWMYCPIYTPDSGWHYPANLKQFQPLVIEAAVDYGEELVGRYVYLTAKTLWVEGGYIGNRPGWHSDGFGTDDVNYIWCDRAPTEFLLDAFEVPTDCSDAMAIMDKRAKRPDAAIVDGEVKHLYKLTPAVIHRCPVGFSPGMRTFVKVSVSRDRYNLEGNSINHQLGERWPLLPREPTRNHPARAAG